MRIKIRVRMRVKMRECEDKDEGEDECEDAGWTLVRMQLGVNDVVVVLVILLHLMRTVGVVLICVASAFGGWTLTVRKNAMQYANNQN